MPSFKTCGSCDFPTDIEPIPTAILEVFCLCLAILSLFSAVSSRIAFLALLPPITSSSSVST